MAIMRHIGEIGENVRKTARNFKWPPNVKNWLRFVLRLVKIALSLYTSGVCFRQSRTYPKNMGVAEIEQFCWLARKKNGNIFKDILPFF